MGKSSAPDAPDYKGQAVATANTSKYSEQTPYGSVGWQIKPGSDPLNPQPGDSTRVTTLSPEQQQLYQQQVAQQLQAGLAGNKIFGDLGAGTRGTEDALYRRLTSHYDQNFGDQGTALRTQLVNQGLAEGSTAYDKAMRNFGQTRDAAYADAADRAVTGADAHQGNLVSQLGQLLAMSRGQTPGSANTSTPTDLMGATQAQYGAQVGKVNAENANTASTVGAGMSLATLAALLL